MRLVLYNILFVCADHFPPLVGDGQGDVGPRVESTHDGAANALHPLGFLVIQLLNELHALVAYLVDLCLDHDIIPHENRRFEVHIHIHDHQGHVAVTNSLLVQLLEIGNLSQIEVGKDDRIVHMSVDIHVVKTDLHTHLVVESNRLGIENRIIHLYVS